MEVSTRIIHRILHNHDIFGEVAMKKLFLTPIHMSLLLDFVRWSCGWSVKDWERDCWIDKSTIEFGINSRQVHLWRMTYNYYSSNCLVSTFKKGRTSVMNWDDFARDNKSKLIFIPKDQ